jgi:hypothetical protein
MIMMIVVSLDVCYYRVFYAMPTHPQIVLQPSPQSPGSKTSGTCHNPAKKRDTKKKDASDDNEDPPPCSDEDKDRPPSVSEALDMPKFWGLEIVASNKSVQEVLKEGDL